MIVGFTGTRDGMTAAQAETVRQIFFRLCPVEVHHGGCRGADIDFHHIVYNDDMLGWDEPLRIFVHPGPGTNIGPFSGQPNVTILRPKPYLKRNDDIAEVCDVLIATPKEATKVLRSGTWATIRYAIKRAKPLKIVLPDGSVLTAIPPATRS